jgi:hypothetical protein
MCGVSVDWMLAGQKIYYLYKGQVVNWLCRYERLGGIGLSPKKNSKRDRILKGILYLCQIPLQDLCSLIKKKVEGFLFQTLEKVAFPVFETKLFTFPIP